MPTTRTGLHHNEPIAEHQGANFAEADGELRVPDAFQVLQVRGRKLNRARDVVIYLARQRAGLPVSWLGSRLGDIGAAAVSLAHRRIVEQMLRDRKLGRQVAQVVKELTGTESKIMV